MLLPRYLIFQFHYGTIKRAGRIVILTDILLFQFHYGTIKSISMNVAVGCALYFNSTMVRLKGYRYIMGEKVYVEFQFHYGTIKSYLSCRAKG